VGGRRSDNIKGNLKIYSSSSINNSTDLYLTCSTSTANFTNVEELLSSEALCRVVLYNFTDVQSTSILCDKE
jgi:hypothetical protein